LSSSNVKQKHLSLDLECDFALKRFIGSVEITFKAKTAVKVFTIDSKNLNIAAVLQKGHLLRFRIKKEEAPFGRALEIHLDEKVAKGDTFKVTVEYETSPDAGGLQWLDPKLTEGKVHPYVFSQFQAIHARTFVPCQDTPSAKITYDATIRAPRELTALMSAIGTGKRDHNTSTIEFYFSQKVKIATYLIAIAVGNIRGRAVGPISTVWCEPEALDAAANEFADLHKFIEAADEVTDYPYRKIGWGKYDLLILPGSFPYGGMENPCLTFVTPTLVCGDKSAVNVVYHELAHSWFGNCLTNKTWEAFWMNEGFTVWLERKIIAKLHGEKRRDMSTISGDTALQNSLKAFSQTPKGLSLVTDLTLTDPDDLFSSIPYEKGSQFLYWLEKAIVQDSKLTFEKCIQAWIKKNICGTVTSEQFRTFFENFYADDEQVFARLNQIPWHAWFYDRDPDGTPVNVISFCDDSLIVEAKDLAARWLENKGAGASAKDMEGWEVLSKVVFLNALSGKVDQETLLAIDKMYNFNAVTNPEIRFLFLRIALEVGLNREPYLSNVEKMLKQQGRMKYTRPLYKALNACDHDYAVKLFLSIDSYNPICVKMVRKDLGI
jgi:leukotriene-A4 hydrolase